MFMVLNVIPWPFETMGGEDQETRNTVRCTKPPSSASPFQVPTDVEKLQDRMECFNADLKADMERWQNNKRQDFRQLLMGMADKNIQYYEKVMSLPARLGRRPSVYLLWPSTSCISHG